MAQQLAPTLLYDFETSRTETRAPIPNDAPELKDMLKDERLDTDSKVVNQIKVWNERAAENKDVFLSVVEKSTSRVVGYFTYNCFRNVNEVEGTEPPREIPLPGVEGRYLTDIGLVLDETVRKRGIATEIILAGFNHIFDILGCQVIRMETEWTNTPWRELMRTVGLGDLESEGRFNFGYHYVSDDNPLGCVYLVSQETWEHVKSQK